MKTSKRFAVCLAAIILALCLLTGALAELPWTTPTTTGQQKLQDYIAQVNANLQSLGSVPINSLFFEGTQQAVLGVTSADNADIPEGVEITISLYSDALNILQLRCSDANQFTNLAGACIQAASANSETLSDAVKAPGQYAKKAMADPANSFEEEVQELNGTSPRVYYAYYPNQYHDGTNWLQMTLVFPMAGYDEAGVYGTPAPDVEDDEEYEGYNPTDDLTHLEIFTTATPEPDSPAGEENEK